MNISQRGLDLIIKYEGFYEDAYVCSGGKLTYGFGSTVKENGQPVKKGDKISQSEALKLLEQQVNEHASTICTYIKVPLNQTQFDALASFQYNLGKNILSKDKSLANYINSRDWENVCRVMLLYNKANGKVFQGLVNRREAEVKLFKETISNDRGENVIDFICPIDDPRLTSKYGMRLHPVLKVNRLHAGIDLVSTRGGKVPICSAYEGVIRIVKTTKDGYGKYVIITHSIKGATYETVYAHLDSYSVKVGQKVKQGERIGVMGCTGIGTGIHLHLEIHKGTYSYGNGTYPTSLDPEKFIDIKITPSSIKATSPPISSTSITSYLEKYSLDSSFDFRKELASIYKISNYTGTVNQNSSLLSKLQNDNVAVFRFFSGQVKDKATANKVKAKINGKQSKWTLHIIKLDNGKYQVKSGTFKGFESIAEANKIVKELGYSVHINNE